MGNYRKQDTLLFKAVGNGEPCTVAGPDRKTAYNKLFSRLLRRSGKAVITDFRFSMNLGIIPVRTRSKTKFGTAVFALVIMFLPGCRMPGGAVLLPDPERREITRIAESDSLSCDEKLFLIRGRMQLQRAESNDH